MVYNVYSIRDSKTGFMSPLVDVNHEAATRNFHHSVLASDSVLRSFASDFSLYQIGTFDSDSGRITPLDIPLYICYALDAFGPAHDEGGDVL